MPAASDRRAELLRVGGFVQGVGFRPFVCRLAGRLGLVGWVRNAGAGVVIRAEGPALRLAEFRDRLLAEAPSSAVVEALSAESAAVEHPAGFVIAASEEDGPSVVRVPRDLAMCPACRREILDPSDRRFGHPFASCTACGPRYSIVSAMPYDRPRTSMGEFPMCPECASEYADPPDRRFHAQPIACPACGPRVAFRAADGRTESAAIRAAADRLRAGETVALKGLGGYQLLCRADDETAVRRLRARKGRPSKPLAVMVASPEEAARFALVGRREAALLDGPANPVVVLDRRDDSRILCDAVAPRLRTVGVFLPTTPLHHLLAREVGVPLVATSGNAGDEPTATNDASAARTLATVADGFLTHDRPILRRADDSLVRVVAGQTTTVRLGRGMAPLPLPHLERFGRAAGLGSTPVLAVGGHQKVALALWTGAQGVLGPHLGDMNGPDARREFARAAEGLAALYSCRPAALACDRHPDYFTTRWAEDQELPVVRVQHHHAHAAACAAEHGLLDGRVLAVVWDGSGYGDDGALWGGEFLVADLAGFDRVASLRPLPLPGGEAAIREPSARALAALVDSLGADGALADASRIERLGFGMGEAKAVVEMVTLGVNLSRASSVGRLFDAVAALVLGVGRISYEGEAACLLEAVADASAEPYPIPGGDWRPLIVAVLGDLRRGVPAGAIAGRFHAGLVRWICEVADANREFEVAISGGCFLNRLLAESAVREFGRRGPAVRVHAEVPANDGGLAAGQLAVAIAVGRLKEVGMCLAVPGLVVERDEATDEFAGALVDFGGLRRRVAIACVPDAAPGDYVLVHAGVAIARIDADEAARTLACLAMMAEEDADAIC